MSRTRLSRCRQLAAEFRRYGIHIVTPSVRYALVPIPVEAARPVAPSAPVVLSFTHGNHRNAS